MTLVDAPQVHTCRSEGQFEDWYMARGKEDGSSQRAEQAFRHKCMENNSRRLGRTFQREYCIGAT
ncbi:hypothetical protein CJF31_00007437 [Rutstroemia sp. NJR-2017a BVV2]|nr:hypothetical protein CJF31_00007437 [Rutstroemia sp. NJR-2017a BVV2]